MDTASAVVERLPVDAPVAATDRAISPAVVFERVSLAFDDHVVLRELSFEVPEGAMTVLEVVDRWRFDTQRSAIRAVLRDQGCSREVGSHVLVSFSTYMSAAPS